MIRFACPGCQAEFTVGDEKAGKTGKCPKCQAAFLIPGPDPADAPGPPPASPPSVRRPAPPSVVVPPPPPATVELAPCPNCQTRLTVSAADIGLNVQCPNCATTFVAARPGPSPTPIRAVTPTVAIDDEEDEDDRPVRRSRRRPRRSRDDSSGLLSLLLFKKMIAPYVIQAGFWLLTVLILIIGGYMIVQIALNEQRYSSNRQLVLAYAEVVFWVPFSILIIRVYIEMVIVFFRIYETLVDIKELTERK